MSCNRESRDGLAWKNNALACFSRSMKANTPGTATAVRSGLAKQEAGHPKPGRSDFAIEVAGIGHVGNVAVVPVGHSWRFLLLVLRRGQSGAESAVCSRV